MADFHTWLATRLAQPELANWLQAFAAVVALGISVWATWRVGAADRKRDRLQARGIAVAIYPELLKLQVSVDYIRKGLEQHTALAGNLVGQSVVGTIREIAQIPIPPMIERNIDRLFMLGGTAGPSCLQLVGGLFQYNTLVEEFTGGMMSMNAEQWRGVMPHLMENLSPIDKAIDKCEHEVRSIHDAVKD